MFSIRKNIVLEIILWATFLAYFLFLVKAVLLKFLPPDLIADQMHRIDNELISRSFANSNLIPFKTIIGYIVNPISAKIAIGNVLGNIIVFIPVGILAPFLILKKYEFWGSFKVSLLTSFGISLAFEVIQLLTYFGSFDVDDLILNTFGGVLGFFIGYLFVNLYHNFMMKYHGKTVEH
ncbi:MAG: VanZ family protein [Candidatus Yonathbacteria bacterium CG_4_10_14_3_um_filter_47_65]|uniref:VanZ family protein n=2 Tax=Parcubacteria group TaxID=1794811 RepID=A0A2M8D8G1_9BACT|nr:MAG: hypothetical protein AUJ44_02425 [Candidatus Nomurabacteria bacterium CG1_02_47_685]PIP03864.1 MAG: VanZ family protein [Candidatus Yonathbacteria bacterium CG23_combo_of_CG06-09_8_20_14_all_46_18]PIQ31743.1 MAG: VanZ family protein [Candidatus Yonathbacteria bacterium CG17_big_fil_post_rev_8_21_14_2_50_46_19]PIX56803.1 MAG: VanZ family protein [Candidatus Yonathbacteria bacterium CG_4_10_14_3_um_filter_47_65]PIY57709.1 MAG: VanZ family protein [Candidatus Yonathbacteria bacterium CG_4_